MAEQDKSRNYSDDIGHYQTDRAVASHNLLCMKQVICRQRNQMQVSHIEEYAAYKYPAKEKIECILDKKDCILKKIRRANRVKPAYNVFNFKLTYRQLKKVLQKILQFKKMFVLLHRQ